MKYSNINPQQANVEFAGPLNEAYKKQGLSLQPQRLDFMARLAAIKMHLDGPINQSEKRLVESYGVSVPETITGMGPATWPSDPGTGVGAQAGAWFLPNYKQGSGDIPSQIMGLAMNVAAYCVGFDLVTTIPVDMPTAVFQFLDAVYGGGLTTSKNAPQYLQVTAAELTSAVIGTFTYGDHIFITKAAKADGVAIHGRFVGKSLFTGALLFKFEATGTLTSAVFAPDAAGTNSVADTLTTIGASAAISKGSSATADDGSATAITSPRVDLVSAIREHIAGASNNDGLTKTPMTRAQSEAGTDRKVQLKLWTKSIEIDSIEILADITRIQLRDLKAYGIDGLAMLYKAAQNQLIQTINDDIVERMAQLGVLNHAQMLTSQDLNLHLFIGPAGTANKALTSFPSKVFVDPTLTDRRTAFGNITNSETNSSAENLYSRQRRLYSRILAGSAIVGTTSRYGQADVCVVNSQIGSALQDCKGFVMAPADNTIGRTGDLHFIGTVGVVRVYVNPKWIWSDTRVVMGRKGTEDDPGLKLLAYDLASSVEIIAPDTMAPKLSILSRYSLIDGGYFPEASYLCFLVCTDFGSWV